VLIRWHTFLGIGSVRLQNQRNHPRKDFSPNQLSPIVPMHKLHILLTSFLSTCEKTTSEEQLVKMNAKSFKCHPLQTINVQRHKIPAEKALVQKTVWDFCDSNMVTAITNLLQEQYNPDYKANQTTDDTIRIVRNSYVYYIALYAHSLKNNLYMMN